MSVPLSQRFIPQNERLTDEQLKLQAIIKELELRVDGYLQIRSYKETMIGISSEARSMINYSHLYSVDSFFDSSCVLMFSIDTMVELQGNILIFTNIRTRREKRTTLSQFVTAYITGDLIPNISGKVPAKITEQTLLVCLRHFEDLAGRVVFESFLRTREQAVFFKYGEDNGFPTNPSIEKEKLHMPLIDQNVQPLDLWVDEDCATIYLNLPISGKTSDQIALEAMIYEDIVVETTLDLISSEPRQEARIPQSNPEIVYPKDDIVYSYQYAMDSPMPALVDFLVKISCEFLARGVKINGTYYSISQHGEIYQGVHHASDDLIYIRRLADVLPVVGVNRRAWRKAVKFRFKTIADYEDPTIRIETKCEHFTPPLQPNGCAQHRSPAIVITDRAKIYTYATMIGGKYKTLRYVTVAQYTIDDNTFCWSVAKFIPVYASKNRGILIDGAPIEQYDSTKIRYMYNLLKFKYKTLVYLHRNE
jgi:hypothetical protein